MILFTSSKGQDFSALPAPRAGLPCTRPALQEQATTLMLLLTQLDETGLQQLMHISPALAGRTREQIRSWPAASCKPALFTYSGEAFRSLDATSFSAESVLYAQHHFRILSGLYGIPRPLDQIAPHRLEMGYKLTNPAGSQLYAFWKEAVTKQLNEAMTDEKMPLVINLASLEYSKVVTKKELCGPWVDVVFQESGKNGLKTIAMYAKRARGRMARYLLQERIDTREGVQSFAQEGYHFQPKLSQPAMLVFTRPQP